MDKAFGELKQIVYEPEEQTRYEKIKLETEKEDNIIIDYIEFNKGEKIYFNRGLNCIYWRKKYW